MEVSAVYIFINLKISVGELTVRKAVNVEGNNFQVPTVPNIISSQKYIGYYFFSRAWEGGDYILVFSLKYILPRLL